MVDRETAAFIIHSAQEVKRLQGVVLAEISSLPSDQREPKTRDVLEYLETLKNQAKLFSKKDPVSLKNTIDALENSETIFKQLLPKTAPTYRK